MGAEGSVFKQDEKLPLKNFVNAIATKYILSQNFQDFISLNDPTKCNNLVILTSKIISEYLDNKEIFYLAQHFKGDKVIDRMTQDDVIYFNKDTISDLDVKNSIKKKRICIGISKFYIKVNMLFSAIITTIKPVSQMKKTPRSTETTSSINTRDDGGLGEMEDKGETGETGETREGETREGETREGETREGETREGETREDKNILSNINQSAFKTGGDGDSDDDSDIEEVDIKRLSKAEAQIIENASNKEKTSNRNLDPNLSLNLEDKHLIEEGEDFTVNINSNTFCGKRIEALVNGNDYDLKNRIFKVNPDFCGMSMNKHTYKTGNLMEEPGIEELQNLYKNDFNYDTGKFVGMSKENKEEYEKDVGIMYEALTNRTSPRVKDYTFKDIKLKNYHEQRGCEPDGYFTQAKEGSDSNFMAYATQINLMIKNNNKFKEELMEILKQVFFIDRSVSPNIVSLNPKLNEGLLDKLIGETRKILVKMYASCEKEFIKTLQIYRKILDITKEKPIHEEEYELQKALGNPVASDKEAGMRAKFNLRDTSECEETDIPGQREICEAAKKLQTVFKRRHLKGESIIAELTNTLGRNATDKEIEEFISQQQQQQQKDNKWPSLKEIKNLKE
jgi:hypothetical protein